MLDELRGRWWLLCFGLLLAFVFAVGDLFDLASCLVLLAAWTWAWKKLPAGSVSRGFKMFLCCMVFGSYLCGVKRTYFDNDFAVDMQRIFPGFDLFGAVAVVFIGVALAMRRARHAVVLVVGMVIAIAVHTPSAIFRQMVARALVARSLCTEDLYFSKLTSTYLVGIRALGESGEPVVFLRTRGALRFDEIDYKVTGFFGGGSIEERPIIPPWQVYLAMHAPHHDDPSCVHPLR
jgi:hypothetical protein